MTNQQLAMGLGNHGQVVGGHRLDESGNHVVVTLRRTRLKHFADDFVSCQNLGLGYLDRAFVRCFLLVRKVIKPHAMSFIFCSKANPSMYSIDRRVALMQFKGVAAVDVWPYGKFTTERVA